MDATVAAVSRDRSRQITPASTASRQVTPATAPNPAPKPKGGFGSATGRFENPGCQSDSQREAKAEERLEALLADPAEEGAQVVMGPTRCAAHPPVVQPPLPTLVCAPQPSRPDSSPQESAQVEACAGDVRTPSQVLSRQAQHPPLHPTARQDWAWSYPQAVADSGPAGRAAQVGAGWAPGQAPEHRLSGGRCCETTQPARAHHIDCPREARALRPAR